MATNIIKIKRTTGTTAPSSLNAGELAFSGGAGTQGNNGQRLFIGDVANSNAVTVIGGNYFSNLMDHVHGTTTAASALIVDTNKSTSEIRTPALYIGTSGSDTLVSSTAAELNLIDGSSAGTIVNSKALIYGAQGQVNATTLQIGGTSITSSAAELNALDGYTGTTAELNSVHGYTGTTAELNIVDGSANSATSTTLADADRVVVNDNGTMVHVALTDFETYFESALDTLSNVTSLGTLTALTVDDVVINGKAVTMTGSSGDTATITVGTDGALDITTVDTAAAAANIQITADGTAEMAGTTVTLDASAGLTLDAGSGTVTFADDGASLGTITSAGWSGNSATFTASANNSTDETVYPVFVDGATGSQGAETDTGLSYNPSTGLFTTVGLDISGNIDVDGVSNLDNTDIDGSLTVDGAVDINATTFDIDATDDIDIDTSDTTGGIAIGTANSGVPITIGHGTSEVTVGDNLTVTGDFQVNGTTTTVNSSTVNIADPVFEIGESGSDDNLDRGIKMKYNSGGAKIAFMGWDDSGGKFAMLHNATDSSSTFTGTQSTLMANIETVSGGNGLKIGDSYPFSDSSGTLTLTNIDQIDATTEATFESAIDTLSNLTSIGTISTGVWQGTAVAQAYGGTGLSAAGTAGFIPVSTGSAWVMQAIDGGTYS